MVLPDARGDGWKAGQAWRVEGEWTRHWADLTLPLLDFYILYPLQTGASLERDLCRDRISFYFLYGQSQTLEHTLPKYRLRRLQSPSLPPDFILCAAVLKHRI